MNSILALFNIGGGEIILILALLLIIVGLPLIALVIILLVTRFGRSRPQLPNPPPIPPVSPPRKCPQCGAELKADMPEGLCPACLLKRGFPTEGGEPTGQSSFAPPSLEELAKLFPQLEILEFIGKGGMGAVYKARQPALDRFVALKILAPPSTGNEVDFESRFGREARALAKLSHPNIVGVYDFGTVSRGSAQPDPDHERSGETPVPLRYFLMEFVDGSNLREIERAGKLSPREALEIVPQICAALQFAHDEGVVHRDIKPENILLDKRGRVKIADFGLARILGQEPNDFRLTGARDIMGTPHYMAPEQVEKPQEVDHRADIYSLGVVFYEMLTGELPLGKFQPPSQKVQVDVRLDEVVLRTLEKEPARRYQQASEVKTRVETISQTAGPGRNAGSAGLPNFGRRLAHADGAGFSAIRVGLRTGMIVCLLIFATAATITFLLPRTYEAVSRLKLNVPEGTYPPDYRSEAVATLSSSQVLKPVADSLDLAQLWGNRYANGEKLNESQVLSLLRRTVNIRQVGNSTVLEIHVFNDSPKEAADVANKIVQTYCALPTAPRAAIIDSAVAPSRAVRPNVWLNIFMGAGAGLFFGVLAGTLAGVISYARRRIVQGERRMGKSSDRLWRAAAVATAIVIAVPIGLGVFGLFVGIVVPNFLPNPETAMRFPQVAPPSVVQPSDEHPANEGIPAARRFVGHAGENAVELVAVSSISSTNPWRPGSYTNQVWWLPDGTPTEAKYDAGSWGPHGPGWSGKDFLFVIRAEMDPLLVAKVTFPDQEMPPTVRFPVQSGQYAPGTHLVAVSLPESRTSTDMAVSIATGPWQLDGALKGFEDGSPVETNLGCGGVDWDVAMRLEQTDDAVRVTGQYTLRWAEGWDQELALLTGDGRQSFHARSGGTFQNGAVLLLLLDQTFDNLRLRDVHEVRFRARPYQIVQFRNVSLQAGFKTLVQIEDAPASDLKDSQ